MDLPPETDLLATSPFLQPPPQDLIARLPAEIIREIFSVVVALPKEKHIKDKKPTFGPEWMPILHVCKRWREIALRHHGIWTTLSTPHVELLLMALRHSGILPLTLDFTHDRPTYVHPSHINKIPSLPPQIFDLLAEALPRVRSMALSLAPKGSQGTLWTRPAPKLESLTLSGIRQCVHHPLQQQHIVISEILPGDIFQGKAPRLRSLRLSTIDIFPGFPLFSAQLKALELKDVRCYTPRPADLVEHDPESLLDALRNAPDLEELRIIAPVSDEMAFERVVQEGPVVSLPKLRKLILEDYAHNIPDFLDRLDIPPICSVALGTIRSSNQDVNALLWAVQKTFPSVPSSAPDNGAFVYGKVRVSSEGEDGGYRHHRRGRDFVHIVISEPQHPSLPAHLELTIDLEASTDSFALLAPLVRAFPPCVRSAPTLVIEHPLFACATAWKMILKPFGEVRELAVSRDAYDGLLRGLDGWKGVQNALKEVAGLEGREILFAKVKKAWFVLAEDRNEGAWC